MEASAVRKLLNKNPFAHPYTLGFFYREKMRAIASIVPDADSHDVLEIGGGTSGLTAMLFPNARVVNLDPDPDVAARWPWLGIPAHLVPASATRLPFASETFDCVTAFDVFEHIPNDRLAAREALRVLKPGGYVLASAPTEYWRYPYYKRPFQRFCCQESEIMAQWGHVRRGYSQDQLQELFPGCRIVATASYLNALTVIAHDISFSRLSKSLRWALILLQYPITVVGYTAGWPGPRLGRAAALKKDVWQDAYQADRY